MGDSATIGNVPHAFLSDGTPGGMLDLNDLIDPGSGWTLGGAQGINNHGQIVGYGTIAGRAGVSAFLLTPVAQGAVPEPSTWLMLIVGFGLAAAAMRRRGRARTTVTCA